MAYLLTRSAKGQHITVAVAPRFIKTSTAKTLGVSAPICNNFAAFVQSTKWRTKPLLVT